MKILMSTGPKAAKQLVSALGLFFFISVYQGWATPTEAAVLSLFIPFL